MRSLSAGLVGLGLGLMGVVAMAQEEENAVRWTVEAPKGAVAPGGKVDVKLTAQLGFGWHIYSLTQGEGGPTPTSITLPKDQPFSLAGKIVSDKPDSKFDENFGIQVESHEESVNFTLPVKVAKTAGANAKAAFPKEIKVEAQFQACTASLCLPPETVALSVPVTVKK